MTFKLYRVNEALGSYHLVGSAADEMTALDHLNYDDLQRLRSFVRFEIHRPDGSRREVARGAK